MAAPRRVATVRMSGNGQVGYLHATAPTPKRKGSSVLRLREDTACGVTIGFGAPLEPQMNVKIVFSTDVRREIDSFESTYDEVPTEATLKEQNEQHGKDRLPLKSDSKEQCFRVWKNVDGTLEVSAIRSPKPWDTGRIAYEGPQMYRFDVLVDNIDVPLQYHFHRDRPCKPRCDSGGGMFYASSLRMKKWFDDNGAPTGQGGGDAPARLCATAIAAVHPDESPRDDSEEYVFGDFGLGTPSEQLMMLPLADWDA